MIGFLGGTFDPIHNGHLHAGRTAAAHLALDSVGMILAARPGHRNAAASVTHRWRMLELAVAGDAVLHADDREMRRTTPSYTVDTLLALRAERGASVPFVWLLGWDAFRGLMSWHRWEDLLALTHLGVLRRGDATQELDAPMRALTAARSTRDLSQLRAQPQGLITMLAAPMLAVSATAVRARLARHERVDDLIPSRVSTYITTHHLYGDSSA